MEKAATLAKKLALNEHVSGLLLNARGLGHRPKEVIPENQELRDAFEIAELRVLVFTQL